MPNVGTITGSMVLDPSAYISGLNQAAGATNMFQQGVSSISFAGFNRGMIASTTLMYTMGRVMSNMSRGMEEYSNILGRIGTVADLTASSVAALADSIRALSVAQGVSRKDIMGGMYVAAQAGYETPAEMRGMSRAGARLSRASGKEIDVKKSVDLMSGIRQALGVGADAVDSGRMTDILLRGRDIGRWELDQMAHALGIPLTVWGNQFAGKQSGEETLRELLSVMSVASLAGVSPNMTATGTRRIVEKTLQLNKSGKVGDPLRNALRGVGFNGQEPILDALNQGGMKYLNTLMSITGDGQTSELTRLGYGSRDLLVLTSAMRGKGEKLNQTYQELSYGNSAGTTERYNERMKDTYDYSRDRLRAQWEITSQEFMQASIPFIGQFTDMLGKINDAAQQLPASVKSFMLLVGAMAAFRLSLNLIGLRVGSSGGPAALALSSFGGKQAVAPRQKVGHTSFPNFTGHVFAPGQLSFLTERASTVAALRPQMPRMNLPNLTAPFVANIARQNDGDYGQPGFFNQLGRYSGASGAFSKAGLRSPSGAYGSMGIGPAALAFGSVASGLGKFGSALSAAIGPLASFAIVLGALSKIYEGVTYKQPGEIKEGGLMKMRPEGLDYGVTKSSFQAMGFLAGAIGNKENVGEYTAEFARKYGAVPDADGKGWSSAKAFWRTGQTALAGYRDVEMDDVMGIVAREQLSPGEVKKFSKGGVNFSDFSTARGYLNEHMKGLGKSAPDDWTTWVRGSTDGINKAAEMIADALKKSAGKIASAGDAAAQSISGKTSQRWSSPWHAGVSEMSERALAEGRLLSGRQWDIYSGTDPKGRNGGLRWDAGGTDHRGMYHMAVDKLDREYGGFSSESYTAGIRRSIAGQNEMWKGRAASVGAKFSGIETDPSMDLALDQGDREYARSRRLRSFMDVMPEIGSMPEADAMGWFTKLTGRDPESDVFAKTNFQNFRNMDLSQFISTKTENPVQYAQATQFGSAEAYNELLQRDKPEERMSIAVDKLASYIDSLMTKQEDVDGEMAKLAKSATKFFDQADATGFFTNISDIADNSGGD